MRERILLVDDEDDVLKLFESFLKTAGYTTVTAQTAFSAFKEIQSGGVDCVVTDMHMPQINGIELLKQVRKLNTAIPVIFVSGQATALSKEHAREFGIHDFLEKPVDRETLIRCVRSALEKNLPEKTRKILIADDHKDIHQLFKTVLEKEGYNVQCVEDGGKAVDAAMKEDFDIILMDIYMPVKNGGQAAQEIVAKKPETFIVMMTGEATGEEIKKAISTAQCHDVTLKKPLPAATLHLTIQNLFNEREKYLQKLQKEKRLKERTAAEILKDEFVTVNKQVENLVERKPVKQIVFLVVFCFFLSLFLLNLIIPLTEVASTMTDKTMHWMDSIEGYLQRDEQRELQQRK